MIKTLTQFTTPLAARVWAVCASSYDPARIAEVCQEIAALETAVANTDHTGALAEYLGLDRHELANWIARLQARVMAGEVEYHETA